MSLKQYIIPHKDTRLLSEYAPGSSTYVGTWPSGVPRYYYRAKNGVFYATYIEGKTADMEFYKRQNDSNF